MFKKILTLVAILVMVASLGMAQSATKVITANVNLNGGCQWTWSADQLTFDLYFPFTLKWNSTNWLTVDYSYAFPEGVYPKIVATPTEFIPALGGGHTVIDSLTYGLGTGWNGHVVTPGGFPGGAGVAKTIWEEATVSSKTQVGAQFTLAFQTFANSTVGSHAATVTLLMMAQ